MFLKQERPEINNFEMFKNLVVKENTYRNCVMCTLKSVGNYETGCTQAIATQFR